MTIIDMDRKTFRTGDDGFTRIAADFRRKSDHGEGTR